MTKSPTFMMAAPQDVLDTLDKEAAKEGLTRQQMLLKIACERYGIEFVARGRGGSKPRKEPDPVYKCKSVAAAVAKAVEAGAPIEASIAGKRYRVFRSGLMKPKD